MEEPREPGLFTKLTSRWSVAIARAANEAEPAWRALAPAWPAFACAIIAALALLLPAQGRIVLLIDASAPLTGPVPDAAAQASHWADAARIRTIATLFAIYLFSLSMMVLALYAMSLRPPTPDQWSAKAAERRRTPPTAPHPSISLRLRAAKFAGLIPPATMVAVLGSFVQSRATQWVLILLMIGAAFVGGLALSLLGKWMRPWWYRADRWLRNSFARDTGQSADAGVRQPWFLWAPLRLIDLLRWLSNPARMELYGVGLGACLLIYLLALATPREATPGGEAAATRSALQVFIVLVTLAAVAASLSFDRLRDKAMRVVSARSSKELIVDRRVQTRLRAASFIVTVLILVLFWSRLAWEAAASILGPTSALLLGLLMVASVLGWFVRNAVAPPRTNPPTPALKLQPTVSLPLRLFLWALDSIGAGVEHAQRWAPAQRIFGLGLWLALIAWPFLDFAEWARGLLPVALAAAAWPVTLALGVVVPGFISWFAVRAIVSVFGSGAPRDKPPAGATSPPRTALLPTPLLILPFLLSGLGANLEPDRLWATPAAAPAPAPADIDAHADAWLRNAGRRVGANAHIPAIIVLAEGGGTRAASQAGALLASLDAPSAQHPHGLFPDIYAISAVSGGAIGTAEFLAAKAAENTPRCPARPASLAGQMERLRTQDHLTPLIVGLFASDFAGAFLPLNLPARLQQVADQGARSWPRLAPNRGDFLELALERAGTEALGGDENWFTEDLDTVVARAAGCNGDDDAETVTGPIVLFGTFGANSQIRAASSNVDFGDCASIVPGDFVSLRNCRGNAAPLSLAAAAHLSARFPLTNPPSIVRIGDQNETRIEHFVDGGYFDNSGAGVARIAVRALLDAAERQGGDVSKRLRIIVVHVFVREPAPARAEASSLVFTEISAPFEAIWSARSSSALMPISAICHDLADAVWRERCDDLPRLRTASRAEPAAEIVTTPDICAAGAPVWLNATLDNHASETSRDFFPLGWLLRPESHARIAAYQVGIAGQIADAVAALRSPGDAPQPACR
jgi:hypothetical protein